MTKPLISRPGYGEGRPAMPTAESKLPSGGPAGKGLPLDPGIPGSSTFVKPDHDTRVPGTKDEPIKRVEGPDDLTKDRDRIDTVEDNAHAQNTGVMGLGGRDPDDTSFTKYPYRDGIPNEHSASASGQWVAQLWLLRDGYELSVPVGMSIRMAAKLQSILKGLNPKVLERAKSCSVSLKRVDRRNLRWLFAVDCGNGVKAVRLHGDREKKNVVKLIKMNLTVSCSCNAWRWLGSEHHSKNEEYLDGKPRGTATPPVIKDPQMWNRICKHVAAVLNTIRDWEVPTKG